MTNTNERRELTQDAQGYVDPIRLFGAVTASIAVAALIIIVTGLIAAV